MQKKSKKLQNYAKKIKRALTLCKNTLNILNYTKKSIIQQQKKLKTSPKNAKKIRFFDFSNLISVQMCSFVIFFTSNLNNVHFSLIFKVLKSYAISP